MPVEPDGAEDTARASPPRRSMSTTPATPEINSGTTAEPYTVHVEPRSQGGNQYLRCRDCKREVIGDDFSRLHHKPECKHREER